MIHSNTKNCGSCSQSSLTAAKSGNLVFLNLSRTFKFARSQSLRCSGRENREIFVKDMLEILVLMESPAQATCNHGCVCGIFYSTEPRQKKRQPILWSHCLPPPALRGFHVVRWDCLSASALKVPRAQERPCSAYEAYVLLRAWLRKSHKICYSCKQ